MYEPPAEPVMYAFSYTVLSTNPKRSTFVVAGGGEAKEGSATYQDRIVRLNDTSPEGMSEKVAFVIAEMERRLKVLGLSWQDAVTTQAYSVQNIGHLVGTELAKRGAMAGGLVWTYARPPVIGLEFEMDVRGAARELVL
jgi:hypothetical protein